MERHRKGLRNQLSTKGRANLKLTSIRGANRIPKSDDPRKYKRLQHWN